MKWCDRREWWKKRCSSCGERRRRPCRSTSSCALAKDCENFEVKLDRPVISSPRLVFLELGMWLRWLHEDHRYSWTFHKHSWILWIKREILNIYDVFSWGFDVFWFDFDSVWLKNPMPALEQAIVTDSDLVKASKLGGNSVTLKLNSDWEITSRIAKMQSRFVQCDH